ncbi:Pentatricopeptide repeat [Dillenia turbinata]|uniref:Pentatricopeptide repeat n=1 Tax=Dillenia turbinata TaxID=194707 RepID=A0AAN8UMY5_9MAGN
MRDFVRVEHHFEVYSQKGVPNGDDHRPDNFTYPFDIKRVWRVVDDSIGGVGSWLTVKSGFVLNMLVQNCLLAMYMNCGEQLGERQVFDEMAKRSVVSWKTMINGYFLNGCFEQTLKFFELMMESGEKPDCATIVSGIRDVITWSSMINGFILNSDAQKVALCPLMQFNRVRPNSVTVASLLVACASVPDVKIGKCLHGWAIHQNYESDVSVENMPINMMTREAIELFKEMLMEEVDPNIVTMKSLLPAYAILADLQQAQNVHGYITQSGFLSRTEIATVMAHMHSKCGNLESAHKIFNSIPVTEKDIVSWSVIIAGYGLHGHGQAAVALFNEMVLSGVSPNDVTFASI